MNEEILKLLPKGCSVSIECSKNEFDELVVSANLSQGSLIIFPIKIVGDVDSVVKKTNDIFKTAFEVIENLVNDINKLDKFIAMVTNDEVKAVEVKQESSPEKPDKKKGKSGKKQEPEPKLSTEGKENVPAFEGNASESFKTPIEKLGVKTEPIQNNSSQVQEKISEEKTNNVQQPETNDSSPELKEKDDDVWF